MLSANVKFTLSSHMYIYMYKFHLLKPASANSQVTLVTSSGAFKNLNFRKVWFYLVKPLLSGANVCKTLRPASSPLAGTPPLGGPWRESSSNFFVLFALFGHPGTFGRVILDALGDVLSFLFSILRFRLFFLLFEPLRDPPGH